MMKPEITLKQIQEQLSEKDNKKAKNKVFRASDFLTDEQLDEVHKANKKGRKRSFSAVDAYIAEIIARFGYATYMAWKNGDISEERMIKLVQAERAREIQNRLPLESIIIASIAGANHPNKTGTAPKSLKMAIDFLKKDQEKAKGEF